MRVFHFTPSLSRSAGGLYFSVSGLANALTKAGVETSSIGGVDQFFKDDMHVWQGVPLITHNIWAGPWSFSLRSLFKAFSSKPDLIHVHGVWSAGSAIGRLAQLCQIPVVVSPRGMLDPWILSRRVKLKSIHAAVFEKPLMCGAHVHALCEAERKTIFEFVNLSEDQVFTVPNGVGDLNRHFDTRKSDCALYLGRLHEKKQVIELIRNWPKASEMPIPLTVAGWGNSHYEFAVRQHALSHDNVEFVGALYGAQRTAALEAARYLVLPSLSEGLPMAVLQSLQFGCVPLITQQCNLPELFEHSIAGCLKDDFSNLLPTLQRQLAKSEREKQAQALLSQGFVERYAWEDIAAEMIVQYKLILAKKRVINGGSILET